jgi:hypothetical protein
MSEDYDQPVQQNITRPLDDPIAVPLHTGTRN